MNNLSASLTYERTTYSSTLDPSEWQFSSADNDLLIAVAGAVFGFPIFVIFLICMLRIRMYYVEKRVRQNALLNDGIAVCSRQATTSGASSSCRSNANSACHEPSTSDFERQRLAKYENYDSEEEHAGTSGSNNIQFKTAAVVNHFGKDNRCKNKNKSKKRIIIPNGDMGRAEVVEIAENPDAVSEENKATELCETVIDVSDKETQDEG